MCCILAVVKKQHNYRMTIYAYIRVSTDAQDLDAQRHGVIQYARRHGWLTRSTDSTGDGLHYFEDKASGRKEWRQRDLGRLIDTAVSGDVLLVSEVSRLARSTRQVLDILEVAAKKGVTVHFAKENLMMDDSMMSHVVATVFALVAQIEASFISARTTEALAKRKAAGLPIGRKKGSKNKNRRLDNKKDEIIGLLKKGVSKAAIAKIVGCDRVTLYSWMAANKLSAYIKKT